jgi:hypothetical protein
VSGRFQGYKSVILQAELLAMPPAAVADFLKRRAEAPPKERRDYLLDEEVEVALAKRDDLLINLSLAQYGRNHEVVAELFRSSAAGSPMRLACLANQSVGPYTLMFPEHLLGQAGGAPDWITSASDLELAALFSNPTLSDDFLRNVLQRGDGWASIYDDLLRRIVLILVGNPRMRTPRESDWMDGYAEYTYDSVFGAAWKLAGSAPTTQEWAYALGNLFDELLPKASPVEDPLSLALRWQDHVDPANPDQVKKSPDDQAFLGGFELVRKGLARLALHKDYNLLPKLLASEDVALRCAAYSAGSITTEQLRAGFKQDGELAFNEALHNRTLWKMHASREALGEVAWQVSENDKNSRLDAPNSFRAMERRMQERHPEWFSEEDESSGSDGEEDDDTPASRRDLDFLNERAHYLSQAVEANAKALQELLRRTGWVLVIAVGLMFLVIAGR